MSQYIGKTIALVSNSDIRYVGLLENIDGNNGTISLSSVRSFGTEGRVTQVERMKPPSDARYGQVIFKGPDVKDLKILDVPLDQVFPEPMPIPPQAMPPFPNMGFPQMPPAQRSSVESVPSNAPQNFPSPSVAEPPKPAAPVNSEPVARSAQPPAQPAQQPAPPQPVSRPSPPKEPAQTAEKKASSEKESQEYDFERNNARFVKEDSAQPQGEFYNKKSSFFDSISSSTEEENRGGGLRWAEEKTLNFDTFGQASLHPRGRGRGGFRGRGRGQFRGRGRGRGRGKPAGFQNAFETNAPAF